MIQKFAKRFVLIPLFLCGIFMPVIGQNSLPKLVIHTENQSPINSKDEYVKGILSIESQDTAIAINNVPMKIRGRGNSTWNFPKKPFKIKLDKEYKLLGMKANNRDWVLLANYCDKSLIRNGVAFEIGKQVGLEYVPDYRFVDVMINGDFVGSYMLTDQVEVANNRVPVEKQNNETVAAGDISGGYLMELDGFADREPLWFQTGKGIKVTIKYPDDEDINADQISYIQSYVHDYENVLFHDLFKDEVYGYKAFTDTSSLINWYIASELTGNSDAFWSTYVYKRRDNQKLFYGPLWDYDIAFNNDSRLGDATHKLMVNYAHSYKAWVERIRQDDWFVNAVANRWDQLVKNGITEYLENYIDSMAIVMDESQQKNFKRWDIMGKKVYLEQELFNSYDDAVLFLQNYISQRASFLSESFVPIEGPFEPENRYYSFKNIRTAKVIEPKNGSMQANENLVIWEPTEDRLQQQWRFEKYANGSYRLKNRKTGLYMQGTGNNQGIIQASRNAIQPKQLWNIVPIGTGKIFGIINVGSGNAADNLAGGFANGNSVIEWDNVINTNLNQQWEIIAGEYYDNTGTNDEFEPIALQVVPSVTDDIFKINVGASRFKGATIQVYDMLGQLKIQQILETNNSKLYVSAKDYNLSSGVYVIKLEMEGKTRAISKVIVK